MTKSPVIAAGESVRIASHRRAPRGFAWEIARGDPKTGAARADAVKGTFFAATPTASAPGWLGALAHAAGDKSAF